MFVLGAVLLMIGALLVLVEAHVPTGGVIGGAAIVAVVAGAALMLVAAGAPAAVALVLAGLAATAAGVALVVGGRRLMRDRRLRPRTGPEALVGHVGVLRSPPAAEVRVFVDGALWRAEPDWQHGEAELHEGDRVVVERVQGLTLCVRKAEEWELIR